MRAQKFTQNHLIELNFCKFTSKGHLIKLTTIGPLSLIKNIFRMLRDEEYNQKMLILRQRRENADRILKIAQKLKKEEKHVERLEKKAFTSLNQIGKLKIELYF